MAQSEVELTWVLYIICKAFLTLSKSPRLTKNNGTLGLGDTIIVDGAKRDRAVWPGDMGIAITSAFVSLGARVPLFTQPDVIPFVTRPVFTGTSFVCRVYAPLYQIRFKSSSLHLVTDDLASVHIDNLSLELAFKPTWANLRAYQGYFHCSDELLNRIWYSGAYTLPNCQYEHWPNHL
jgi:hypothetical protein